VDLSDPTRAITPSLDGPVLAVLARAARPLTVGDVAEQATRGSEIGIRKCLARLVEQGVVRSSEMGRNRVHELNHEHVAASAAVELSKLRSELWKRMRDDVRSWNPKPLFACVFGSAARGDGDTTSDIDFLVVHRPFPGDPKPPKRRSVPEFLSSALFAPVEVGRRDVEKWVSCIDRLRPRVLAWSGNSLHVVDISMVEWLFRVRESELGREVEMDGVVLAGYPELHRQIVTNTGSGRIR
jgi:predicted nucleotidyltransferase